MKTNFERNVIQTVLRFYERRIETDGVKFDDYPKYVVQ